MRLLALAAALLLAGCLSPTDDYARDQALAAPANTERALGFDGAARAQEVRLAIRGEGLRLDVAADTDYFEGDAWTTTLRYGAFEVDGANRTAEASAIFIAIACTPALLVAKVSGGSGFGLPDLDAQTNNTAGACTPSPSQEAAFQASVDRVLSSNARLVSDLGQFGGGRAFPDLRLKTAEWQANGDVAATYDAVDGERSVPLTAVVRDARLQSTHASLGESGVVGEVNVRYIYGERDPEPGWRGATVL